MKLLYTILITLSLLSCSNSTNTKIYDELTTNNLTIPIISTFENIYKLYAVSSSYYNNKLIHETNLCYFKWSEPVEQLSDKNAFIELKPVHGYTVCVLHNLLIPSYVVYNDNLIFDIYTSDNDEFITSLNIDWDHNVYTEMLMDDIGIDIATIKIMASGLIFKDLRNPKSKTNCTFDNINVVNNIIHGVVICGDNFTLTNAPIDVTINILDNYHFEIFDDSNPPKLVNKL